MSREIAKSEQSMSERFMNGVITEFRGSVGDIALTNFQKRLAQNYFICADMVLKAAEERRLKKSEKYRDLVPVTWGNIDMENLAQSVVSAARIGWDPMQANHVHLIPFKDNANKKYKLTFMPGYRGIELRAIKYGLDVPDAVIIETVYANDKFKSIKKDRNNAIESYEFEIVNDFDRGELIGGFYYHGYSQNPEKNKLVVFSRKDIEKRKPAYASPEFWGGEKDVWKNGKKTGRETVEGWYDQMCYKTIYRAAYNDITIDSQKIDDDFLRLKQLEGEYKEAEVAQEISQNANREVIDITPSVEKQEEDITEAEIIPEETPEPEPKQQTLGPDF